MGNTMWLVIEVDDTYLEHKYRLFVSEYAANSFAEDSDEPCLIVELEVEGTYE